MNTDFKKMGPLRRAVASRRNSMCGSARLEDLDWSNWFADGRGGELYLHVRRLHPDFDGTDPRDATWHRVFCRQTDRARLTLIDGKLFWLIDRATPQSAIRNRLVDVRGSGEEQP